MSSLLAHALKQEISLPVAYLFVLVPADSQLFKLAASRGPSDGYTRFSKRSSGSLGVGPRLRRENLLRHLGQGLIGLHGLSFPTRVCVFHCNTPNKGNPHSTGPDGPGPQAGRTFVAQRSGPGDVSYSRPVNGGRWAG